MFRFLLILALCGAIAAPPLAYDAVAQDAGGQDGGAQDAGTQDVVATDRAQLRYHVLTRHMSAFEELAPQQRDKVTLTVRIVATAPSPRPVRLWMVYGGRRTELPVDPSGFVRVPRSPDIIAADPLIETNQPRGSVESKLAMLLTVPDRQRFHYADLMVATSQVNALIDQAAGLVSFLLSPVIGVQFSCPAESAENQCTLVVHRPGGDEVLRPNTKGKIRLMLSSSLASENPLIEGSVPFAVIEPLTD